MYVCMYVRVCVCIYIYIVYISCIFSGLLEACPDLLLEVFRQLWNR